MGYLDTCVGAFVVPLPAPQETALEGGGEGGGGVLYE